MIKEFFAISLARSAPGAREAGLVYQAAALSARYRRQHKSWAPHITAMKNLITQAISDADPLLPIVILGAGSLIDLPFEALVAHKAGVYLIDAVEPFAVRLKLRRHKHIKFFRHDVTGLLESYKKTQKGAELTAPNAAALLPEAVQALGPFGLVISDNLLSQTLLAFMPLENRSEADQDLALLLARQHIAALKELGAPALLISDFASYESRRGKSRRLETVPALALPGEPSQIWDWQLAPYGEIRADVNIHLKVGVWPLHAQTAKARQDQAQEKILEQPA